MKAAYSGWKNSGPGTWQPGQGVCSTVQLLTSSLMQVTILTPGIINAGDKPHTRHPVASDQWPLTTDPWSLTSDPWSWPLTRLLTHDSWPLTCDSTLTCDPWSWPLIRGLDPWCVTLNQGSRVKGQGSVQRGQRSRVRGHWSVEHGSEVKGHGSGSSGLWPLISDFWPVTLNHDPWPWPLACFSTLDPRDLWAVILDPCLLTLNPWPVPLTSRVRGQGSVLSGQRSWVRGQ